MLVLFDTPAGHALFRVKKPEKLKDADDLHEQFADPEKAGKMVSLKAFSKFVDTAEALQSATALVEGRLSSGMKKFLKKNIKESEDTLAALDARGSAARSRRSSRSRACGTTA